MDIIAKETVTYSATADDFDSIETSLNSLLSAERVAAIAETLM